MDTEHGEYHAGINEDRADFEAQLTAALDDANLPTVLAVLVQLTGDRSYLEDRFKPGPMRGSGDHDDAGLDPERQRLLRQEAKDVIMRHRRGQLDPAAPLEPSDVVDILSVVVGDEVPENEAGLLSEELGLVSRRPTPLSDDDQPFAPRVLIIGAGFSGLAAAIRLQEAGLPFTVVDKNEAPGGTWVENIYPGAGVDTPVHLYSFSFAQRPDWPRYFAGRPEVAQYLLDVAKENGVAEAIEYGTEVREAVWSDNQRTWDIELCTSDGKIETRTFDFVVSAVGQFNRASWPDLPGLDTFEGPVEHTAQWQPEMDLAGKRVAVVGSGASAMQLVPAIRESAAHTFVFQQSPQWILPNPNTGKPVSQEKQFLMANVPGYLGWYRLRQAWNFGDRMHPVLRIDPNWQPGDRSINEHNERHRQFLTRYIESKLEGRPDLLAKCVPTYPPYGKRPLLDHGWFEALCSDHVTLVNSRVAAVEPDSVSTASGERFEVDVIILATGFETLNMLGPIEVRGRSGATLRESWGVDDAKAMLGMTVPDFPNFLMLFGPNTNAGHGGSLVMTVEMQVRYLIQMLTWMSQERLSRVEARPEAFDAYITELDAALAESIWTHPGMSTYYRNAAGRIVTNLPWTNAEYWHRTATLDRGDYVAD
ncbi:MAG TPA: FAD-dependent oxidoreductase [Mycobacterium sp.]